MKIRLAILEKDSGYLGRIVSVFSTKYADKFQIYSFTDMQIALSALNSEKIDVFIANDSFEIDVNVLPKRCSFAYFVDSSDIETVNGQRAVCKFQKAELIYKQILSLYSENAGNISGIRLSDDACKIITFSSPAGGTGTSTMAAACSIYFAAKGHKVLYLNLENYGVVDIFFSGEGQNDMSDVIFSIKSRKANLSMKLESYVKQSQSGVYFFSQAKYALDMIELKHEERMQLINELEILGTYDYIIIDTGFGIDKEHFDVFKKSIAVVMVSDGTEIANIKTNKAYAAMMTIDQNAEIPLANRFCLVYNKFSNKISTTINNDEIKDIGGAPVYAHASVAQIIGQLSSLDIFEKLV